MQTTESVVVQDLLRCPISGAALLYDSGMLTTKDGKYRYALTAKGIPLFAEAFCSDDAKAQQAHYDDIANAYATNLTYAHTEEYMAFLDRVLVDAVDTARLGIVAELCCGRGEAFQLLGKEIGIGIGVDVSVAMLDAALEQHDATHLAFVQGDATMLPLAGNSFDSVFMLGGIHHVNDRSKLFAEISRILKPGGRFYFREPVSDFFLWRWIRSFIYRISPTLDHETERPLLYQETVPVLKCVNLDCVHWRTHGFIGFCFFMNSDVLIFNRLFRFIPGIRRLTRWFVRFDEWTVALPGLQNSGLQVVGVAEKPLVQTQ